MPDRKLRRSAMTLALWEAGYTGKDAAEAMGISRFHLYDVASGRTHPSQKLISGFKRLTGRDIAEVLPPSALDRPYDQRMKTKKPRDST